MMRRDVLANIILWRKVGFESFSLKQTLTYARWMIGYFFIHCTMKKKDNNRCSYYAEIFQFLIYCRPSCILFYTIKIIEVHKMKIEKIIEKSKISCFIELCIAIVLLYAIKKYNKLPSFYASQVIIVTG